MRNDKVDKTSSVTLPYRGRMHHIGVGRPYAGWRIILLVAGREIRILGAGGSPLRQLVIDHDHDYQRKP